LVATFAHAPASVPSGSLPAPSLHKNSCATRSTPSPVLQWATRLFTSRKRRDCRGGSPLCSEYVPPPSQIPCCPQFTCKWCAVERGGCKTALIRPSLGASLKVPSTVSQTNAIARAVFKLPELQLYGRLKEPGPGHGTLWTPHSASQPMQSRSLKAFQSTNFACFAYCRQSVFMKESRGTRK